MPKPISQTRSSRGIHENVGRFDVLMDKTSFVQPAKRS